MGMAVLHPQSAPSTTLRTGIGNPQSNTPHVAVHNASPSASVRRQRNAALSLVMAFVIVLLLVQLWLLVEAVEGYLGGAGAIAVPAAIASGLCSLGIWGLWRVLQ